MFGKILLTLAVIAVMWFAFRHFARAAELKRRAEGEPKPRKPRGAASEPEVEAESMVECRVCGTWQPARTAKSCGRADCPY